MKFKYAKEVVLIIVGLLLVMGVYYAYVSKTNPSSPYSAPQTGKDYEPRRAALTGTYLCLPHKDATGPQTDECAIGLRTDDGLYYALDLSLSSQTPPPLTVGDRIRASGLVTPIERLSSDHWQKYQVTGIFSVTDSLMKLED